MILLNLMNHTDITLEYRTNTEVKHKLYLQILLLMKKIKLLRKYNSFVAPVIAIVNSDQEEIELLRTK